MKKFSTIILLFILIISSAISRENKISIKELLNNNNSTYFPIDDKSKQLKIEYIGTIKNFKIYKTVLLWNINNSFRTTHRLVFIKNEKVEGMYTGIQSDKIKIKDNKITFEDIDYIIEINDRLSENIYIDGEIFCLEK
ncbi:MAG: hypothetical protein K6B17_07305 [Treponema sp.]|nr:hypothetical protein [Treponema sp.]